MKRMRANLASDEMYLIAIAFSALQVKFETNREYAIQAYGTFGAEVYDRYLSVEKD